MLITFDAIDLVIGLAVGGVLLAILSWRGQSSLYLVAFALFWMYLLLVVAVVAFPIAVGQRVDSEPFSPSINLQPFYVGACQPLDQCLRRLIENVMLTIPCGFGLPLLISLKPKWMAVVALGVGLSFEVVQLALALLFQSGFRVIDINDAILTALGVIAGYGLLRLFTAKRIKLHS